jgi:hypothetical protein
MGSKSGNIKAEFIGGETNETTLRHNNWPAGIITRPPIGKIPCGIVLFQRLQPNNKWIG